MGDRPDRGPEAYGLRSASDEERQRWEEVVERVLGELKRAGLPAKRVEPNDIGPPGALVTMVRLAKDDGGGVFVEWKVSEELDRASLGLPLGELDDEALNEAARLLPLRGNDPNLVHAGAVAQRMQEAIIGILGSAGLRAFDPGNEYDPYGIQVELP